MTESQPRAQPQNRNAPRPIGPGALWLVFALVVGQVLLYALLSMLFHT
jgi:hypothetical protein